MHKLAFALAAALALTVPALAQKVEEPKKVEDQKKNDEAKKIDDAKKGLIPGNTFFRGQTANEILAKERLLGAKVVNKDGQTIGTIEDLIVAGNQVDGVILGVGAFVGTGDKKIGVRFSALTITTADGKTTISLPVATKEMLAAVPAYQRAGTAAKK